MCSKIQLEAIIQELVHAFRASCSAPLTSAILFGSYARQDADDESDVDVLLLIDAPREELAAYRRSLAEIAGNLLCEYGVVVSPILESTAFYERNRTLYPFFISIDQEGIHYAA